MKRGSVRVDKVLHDAVARAARSMGISKSEFVRRAIAEHSGIQAGQPQPSAVKGGVR